MIDKSSLKKECSAEDLEFYRSYYRDFLQKMKEGDKLFHYSTLACLSGSAGLAIVRNGEIVETKMIVRS